MFPLRRIGRDEREIRRYKTPLGVFNIRRVAFRFLLFKITGKQFKAYVANTTATANSSGQIVITYTAVKGNALASGIEILP